MYICSCNPFTDKDVRRVLEDEKVKNSKAQVYKAASGGQVPCCGSCMCVVNDMIVDHNATQGVRKLKEDLPEFAEAALIAAE